MKKISILAALLVCSSFILAESPGQYSRIKIFVPDKATIVKIWESGIDHEGSSGRIGGWMEFIAGSYELQQLAKNGVQYSIVVEDLQKEEMKHLYPGPLNALGFGYGSMGGFYTYSEVLQQLDSMRTQYPSLITERESLGPTWEARALWVVKISQNADVDDPDKPEVLYTALHHAREPEGMMTIIYYMWWLLQNYGTDPDATYLLNNRQIWFLPVVNPDGYVYNQTTNPGGGGYWRKNRRNNGSGYGVDLNRNYGDYDMWNSPYGGSDTYAASDVYRGPSPFSEPETNDLRYFVLSHNFKTCLNYHTFGNDCVYPWGYLPWETPDSVAFREFCFDMTGYNRYVSGVDMQTVGYVTRGNSDDYLYGSTEKPKIFSMTPEVGPSFWPSSSLILPLAVANLEPNKYFSFVAGQYTIASRFNLVDQNHNGGIEKGESFSLDVTLRNKGLGDAGKIRALISTANPNVIWTADTDSIEGLPARTEGQVAFSGFLIPGTIRGGAVEFFLRLTDPSGYLHRDTLSMFLGAPDTLFEDSGDSGTGNWNTGVSWDTTSDAHSSPAAFTDSPGGNYTANANNALTLKVPISLVGYDHVLLKFWTKWQVEPAYDFAYVEVSSNSGTTWSTLRSPLSHRGSGVGVQTIGTWGFDGYTPGMEWVEQDADLSPFAGSSILIRFRLVSDGGSNRDGIYIDDIGVFGYKDSLGVGVCGVPYRWRWNLVSVPVIVSDARRSSVFPQSTGPVYSFEAGVGYIRVDTLLAGRGYWAMFPAAETLAIIGTPITAETIAVHAGWNLVGSLSVPIPASSISSVLPGLVTSEFFGYIGGYATADTTWPGKGYWVKANHDGSLIMSAGTTASPAMSSSTRIRIEPTGELPPPPPPSDIQNPKSGIPSLFALDQNYPNPFNPTTTIRYQLPVNSLVRLGVYDMLGQEIATLANGIQNAGYRSVEWRALGVTSGVYFYRLEAMSAEAPGKTFMQIRKLLLLK